MANDDWPEYNRALGALAEPADPNSGRKMGSPEEFAADVQRNTEVAGILERAPIWRDVVRERARQDKQWGGPEHDDIHRHEGWATWRSEFDARAADHEHDPERVYAEVVKVAALAVAQLESLRRLMGPERTAKLDADRQFQWENRQA
jgi:hypothetical protein